MLGYHVRTGGEVAELRDSSVEEVDVLKKADCWNLTLIISYVERLEILGSN